MRLGLALPQYDYSVPGIDPLTFDVLLDHARLAASVGYEALYLSDHLWLDLAKYGADATNYGTFEPIATLGALARLVPDVSLGTLVLCEAFRPAAVLAKALATLDRLSDGRLEVGLGGGWYTPEYDAIGLPFPSPGERLERLGECLDVVTGMFNARGEPFSYDGRVHRADGARLLPPSVQDPRPPVFVGGSGDRLLRLAARKADGWNVCWKMTPEKYRERMTVVERALDEHDRDPATFHRTLGLYALVGENETDLARRYERLQQLTPAGVLDAVSLDEFRADKLVGTVERVQEQAAVWASLGIETLILGVGAVPFQVVTTDDLELCAHALRGVSAPSAAG
jgi:alkanesulfonate monooxygenase SsuD/methylene tetrahydromethanopterin reductase-like flavin-dependent oxidoreductase (luciferase family)